MTMDTLICRDVFVRHTEGNGRSYVMCHRVWDADRFLAAQVEAAKRLAREAHEKNQPFLHKAEQITEDQYRKERVK